MNSEIDLSNRFIFNYAINWLRHDFLETKKMKFFTECLSFGFNGIPVDMSITYILISEIGRLSYCTNPNTFSYVGKFPSASPFPHDAFLHFIPDYLGLLPCGLKSALEVASLMSNPQTLEYSQHAEYQLFT
jgi:hypothetical protein